MRNPSQISARRPHQLLRLACLACLVGVSPCRASAAATCLTPEAGRALSDLVAAGALQRALGSDFRLTRGDVGGNQIELEIADQAQRSYVLILAIQHTRDGSPDGAGRRFAYYLDPPPPSPHPDPAVRAALLAVAALVDEAVPETALQPCSQQQTDPPPEVSPPADAALASDTGSRPLATPQQPAPRRYPRAVALAGAVAQFAVLVGAILFGVHVVGSTPSATGPRSDADRAE